MQLSFPIQSTIMKAIAARAIPIPSALDIYFLDSEYPARDDITALEAVMESNDEVAHLEQKANQLNHAMAEASEEEQNEIQMSLEAIYDRLDQLDVNTAQARATTILHGLGFTVGTTRLRYYEIYPIFVHAMFIILFAPSSSLDPYSHDESKDSGVFWWMADACVACEGVVP
jgi:ATP-binding cassette subfamily F protein 2